MSQQPYILDLRNGGAPATGLAAQLNAGTYQSATAPTGAAITANLPTWAESTLIPGLYGCMYDALTNGPLNFGVTLTGLSDPNEANVRVSLLADPALIAAAPSLAASAVFAASYLTIPGDHTISGTPEVLTYKQWMALQDAISGGDDSTPTAPVAGGSATVSYYLRGQPKTSGNLVAVATVTYDALKNQTGRTVKVAQPFPPF